jgi:hypothetical protein
MLKNPKKADLNKDGKLSGYEKKRGMAIEKSMSGKKFGGAMKYNKGGGADTGRMGEIRSKLAVFKDKFKKKGIRSISPEQRERLKKIKGAISSKEMNFLKKMTPSVGAGLAQKLVKKIQNKKMGGGLMSATKKLKAEGKMGGGMMKRPMGYSKGMSIKDDNLREIRKTESMIGASKSSRREQAIKKRMGGGMMQKPMGYDKGGMKDKKIVKIAIGIGKAKDYPGMKKIMEMNKKGKKRFNTGGSVSVSTKLGRNKPTKLY